MSKLVVLVHGWSVTSTDTYGQLPARLEAEASAAGLDVDVRHIWLGRYVSFRDEVRVEDISRAFETALRTELGAELTQGKRLVAITHSTGGPVVRDWWHRFYASRNGLAPCPLSHLIMLAPANFGSALAQLGKSTVARIPTWFKGVEPGQGVLDWLELGSPESIALNRQWIETAPPWQGASPMYPFVLTGQRVDRSLYDHVNSYTGETGSDGVVRAAAANLNASYVRLEQEAPRQVEKKGKQIWEAPSLVVAQAQHAPKTAFAVLPQLAHSGPKHGILRSIKVSGNHATVDAILRCLSVDTPAKYVDVCAEFEQLTVQTQKAEQVETEDRFLLPDSNFIHDRYSMVIARVSDAIGHALDDFDVLLLGEGSSADHLPKGFFVDRQRNKRARNTLTYYLSHDVMIGGPAVPNRKGDILRPASRGTAELGFRVNPRPQEGFVHYLAAELKAQQATMDDFLLPNRTLILDIVMRRVVRSGTFTLTRERKPAEFKNVPPGDPIKS